jgi:hypothetical protein
MELEVCTLFFFAHPPTVLLLLRQRRVADPAWAPRLRTYNHVDKGASTPQATPRPYAAGAVGAFMARTCVCVAKLRQSLQLFEGTSPRGVTCLCLCIRSIKFSCPILLAAAFSFDRCLTRLIFKSKMIDVANTRARLFFQ